MFLVYEKNTFGGELELKENELSGVRGLLEKTEKKLASFKAIVSKENLDKCFNVTKISEPLDVSVWELAEGLGFAMKLPLGFYLKELEPEVGALASYVVTREDGGLSVGVSVWDMREGYVAELPDAPPLFYEFLSDTWWQYPDGDILAHNHVRASECLPNDLVKKEDLALLLYAYAYNLDNAETAVEEAEEDPFQKIYFVLMRDVKDKTYAPLIISLSIRGDKNAPEFEEYEGFREILETVIRTFETRPIED